MSAIDTRVVEMKFNNAQFEQAARQTLGTLQMLNKSMKLEGAAKGFNDLNAASEKVNLSHIANGVQSITDKFKTMSVVGITAIQNVTNRAIQAGAQLIKSLTISPVMDGFREYETNMNSIQTIMANTGLEGQKGLNRVNKALDELNHYSDQTIYNFSEMARNIGTFTAAGVSLKTSTAAIKGIANLAAVSGSNAEQASSAMYQLSQALAAGKVSLEDWNSVVNAGMGGKVFQNALMETARVHGVAIDKMVKDEGSFRLTLQKGWLTSDILTETLSKFTGDLNARQLKSMGYTEKQIKGILKMGKTAQDAATKVKTISQLIDTLREAVGSGWATTWKTLFGDFGEAKTLFTSVSNVLGGFIQRSSDARNKVLKDWKALGGRTALITAIGNAFKFVMSVLKPIKDAFREVFPPTTGKQLYQMTVALRDFTEKLKIGGDTADKLKRTFKGVFSIFGIGWDIIKGLAGVLFHLFSVAGSGGGGFLDITAKIGDFLVAVRKAIHDGNALTKFFHILGNVLAIPIKVIQKLTGLIGDLFSKFDSGSAGKGAGKLTKEFDPLGKLGNLLVKIWGKFTDILGGVWDKVEPLASKFGDFFDQFAAGVGSMFQNLDFGDVLKTINTGLFGGFLLLIKNFMGKFKGGDGDGLGGIVDAIKEPFNQLTDTLSAMQNTLRAATLLEIAAAIGIMVLSVSALSKIDSDGLKRALTAMTAMFVQLFGSMAIFEKVTKSGGFAKMPLVTGAMILLAIAVDLLSIAVKKLSGMSWSELAKGLTGVAVILGVLVASVRLMPNEGKLISSSLAMIAMAAAVKILASAVTDIGGLSWGEIAKGLVGVGALLLSLALYSKFTQANAGGVLAGAGIILLAAGIKILASAMQDFAGMSWSEIARGLVAMAGSLVIVGAALYAVPATAALSAAGILITAISLGMVADALEQMGNMSWGEIGKGLTAMFGAMLMITAALYAIPPTAALSAAGILITAMSLGMIADALEELSKMSWSEIAKSLVALGGSLLIIALAMNGMQTALPGAAALLIVTAALKLLLPVIQAFSEMSWGEILKGLTALAGVFLVLGVAGVALTPVVGTLLLLGAAITLLGIGVLAVGAGVLLFATALTALAAAGGAATLAIVAMITGIAGSIPVVMKQIGNGVVEFVKAIENSATAIVKALVNILVALIDGIAKLAPKIIDALYKMISKMLSTMLKYVPKMTDTGMKLIIGVLNGIAKNAGRLSDAAANVVVQFINGISRNLPKITNAAANMIIKFVNSLASTIRSKSSEMGAAGANLASAIIQGMVRGLASGNGIIASKARSVAKSALDAAKNFLGIHSPSKEFQKVGEYVNQGFAKGLTNGSKKEVDKAFKTLKDELVANFNAADKAYKSNTAKLKKLTAARHKDYKAIKATKAAIAQASKEHHLDYITYRYMKYSLDDEQAALDKLGDKYDAITPKIIAAKKVLEDATKTRDDYNKTVTDQYDALPSLGNDSRLATYIGNLKQQISQTKTLTTMVQQLRKLGLNDALYKQIISAGTSALPFVQQLLASGQTGVNEVNKLGKDLDSAAAGMGKTASSALYQAAVDSAAGIVKGLENQQAAIQKQMDKIADGMVKAIKKKLGIKSPSKEFAKVGGYSMAGLAQGIRDTTDMATKSSNEAGVAVLDTLRKSLANVSNSMDDNVDISPVITPVLDLTNVKKNAGQIGSMLNTTPIRMDSAYSKAQAIYDAHQQNKMTAADTNNVSGDEKISFTQINNSPKALSSAEVYRQTKNQLSVAKGALVSP